MYRGDLLGALIPVGAQSVQSYGGDLEFNAQAGVEYRIAFGGIQGSAPQSDVELKMKGEVEAPQFTLLDRRPDGLLQLRLYGSAGAAFTLESSTDLATWREQQRGIFDSAGWQSILAPITSNTGQFFRFRIE